MHQRPAQRQRGARRRERPVDAAAALLRPLLGGLLGAHVDLALLDDAALARTDVDLLRYLRAVAVEAGAAGPEAVLVGRVGTDDALRALLGLVEGSPAGAVLQAVIAALPAPVGDLDLGRLFDVDPTDLARLEQVEVRVLDLLVMLLQLHNAENVVATPAPVVLSLAGVGGLLELLGLDGAVEGRVGADAEARVHLQVVEPPVLTVVNAERLGDPDASFRSAGVRLAVELVGLDLAIDTQTEDGAASGLLDGLLDLLGVLVGGLVATEVDLTLTDLTVFGELGAHEGYVESLDLDTGTVTVRSKGGLAHLHLGEVDPAVFFDRTRTEPVEAGLGTVAELRLSALALGGLLADLEARAAVKAKANGSRTLPASGAVVLSGPFPAAAELSGTGVSDLTSGLLEDLEIDVDVTIVSQGGLLGGLGVAQLLPPLLTVADGLVSTLLGAVDGVADLGARLPLGALLDRLLGSPVFDLLGVGVGRHGVAPELLRAEPVPGSGRVADHATAVPSVQHVIPRVPSGQVHLDLAPLRRSVVHDTQGAISYMRGRGMSEPRAWQRRGDRPPRRPVLC